MQVFVACNKLAIVDDEDIERLCRINWSLDQGYLRYKGHKMHWYVVGPAPDGLHTDHINRNKLDNRKCNLRFVTRGTNIINQTPFRGEDNKNIYPRKGWYGSITYQVTVRRDARLLHVGTFRTKAQAIAARDAFIAAKNTP